MEFTEEISDPKKARFSVGRGGVFIPMSSNFPTPHETLQFEIETPRGETKHLLKGFGLVRWVRPNSANPALPSGIGLELKSLNPESISALRKIQGDFPTVSFIPLA